MQVHHVPNSVSRMVDMDVAVAKGNGYEKWAKIHNLKNALYNRYHEAKEKEQQLSIIRHNIEQTLGRKIKHKQEQER